MDNKLLIPIGIALVGAFTLNIGFVLQKSQASQLPSLKKRMLVKTIKEILECRRWILGTLLTSFGWLLFLLAIAIAPLTVIAPINNAGVIVLALVSVIYLQEKLAIFEWAGFVMIFLGVIIIPISASTTQGSHITMNNFLLSLLTIVIIIGFIVFNLVQRMWFPTKSGVVLGIIAGVTGGLGAVYTKVLSQIYTEFPIGFIVIIIILIFQALSFITLQTSFQKERAMVIVPLFNSFSTLIPLIFGLLVFSESMPIGQLLGILLVVVGASTLFRYSDVDISIE